MNTMDQLWHFLDGGMARNSAFTPESVLLSLLLAFVLGQLLAWIYYCTHAGLSYSRSFVQSLILIAIMGAVAERATTHTRGRGEKAYLERWVGAWRVLGKAMKLGKGYVATSARTLVEKKNRPAGGLVHPDVAPLIGELQPLLNEAGLMPSA